MATDLAPHEVHSGRLPWLPLTIFDRTGVVGHQSLARHHLVFYDLATDWEKRANDIVCEHHALTVSGFIRRNSALADALRPTPNFTVGGWAWVYNSASTIRQGVKANTDAKDSRTNSRLTGRAGTRSWPSVSAPPPRSRTVRRSGATSSIWISIPIYPVRTLVGAWPLSAANPVLTPTTAGTCLNTYRRGWRSACSTIVPRNPHRTTSLKTTFRPPSNGGRWSRSLFVSRYGGEVASSRCYTRRIGWDSPNLPESGKWTSTSPAPTSCVIGPEARTSTSKSTASTAKCGSGGTSRDLPQQRGTFPSAGLRLCSPHRLAPSLPRQNTF